MQNAIEKERVLGKFMAKRVPDSSTSEERYAAISKQRDIPEWSVPHYLSDLYKLSLSSDPNMLVLSSFTDRITELVAQVCPHFHLFACIARSQPDDAADVDYSITAGMKAQLERACRPSRDAAGSQTATGQPCVAGNETKSGARAWLVLNPNLQHSRCGDSCDHVRMRRNTDWRGTLQFKDMSEEELDEHSSHAAEFCWLTGRQDLSRDRLFKEDFEALLPDKQDAEVTFSLFDLDGDGCALHCAVYMRARPRCVRAGGSTGASQKTADCADFRTGDMSWNGLIRFST